MSTSLEELRANYRERSIVEFMVAHDAEWVAYVDGLLDCIHDVTGDGDTGVEWRRHAVRELENLLDEVSNA